MLAFAQLVATLYACISIGALAGALVADTNGYSVPLFVGMGAVVGIVFGLVAAGEARGRSLDAVYPPGDEADIRE